MKPESRFGDYLLLRRLSTSPLGDVHRAGRLQARAIDRVVRLLRFNGETIDREKLAQDAVQSDLILASLEPPRFASGLECGHVDGVPFVAYDYLSGRSLAEILQRATARGPGPERGLLLATIEQVSATLTAAAAIRVDGVPIRHGFLIPDLLLLSAEGKVHPLGFSLAPALARQDGLRQRYASYIAPEARSGHRGQPTDDVYALAAILFEALTGSPPTTDRNTAEQVDQALFATGGIPFPPPLQDLLKSALAAGEERLKLHAFHRALNAVLEATEDAPSEFQLAFFLHRLFREEIETEAVEMREEKSTHFAPLSLASDEAEAELELDPQPEAEAESEPDPKPFAAAMPPPARRGLGLRPFLAGLGISLTVAVVAAGLTSRLRGATAEIEESPQPRVTMATSISEHEVEQELRRLVSQRAAALQEDLENEYEPRLTELRRELADARSRSEARSRQRAAAEEVVPRPLRSRGAPDDNAITEPPPSTPPAAMPPVIEDYEPPVPGLKEEPAPQEGSASADPIRPPVTETGSTPPADRDSLPGIAETEVESVPQTRTESGSATDFSPPRLLEPPRPVYPAAALRLKRTALVQLRVLVDKAGRVSETEVISAPKGLGFERSAIAAAAGSRWTPALRNGEATTAWAVLTIDFRL